MARELSKDGCQPTTEEAEAEDQEVLQEAEDQSELSDFSTDPTEDSGCTSPLNNKEEDLSSPRSQAET